MANVTLSVTETALNVSTTLSNITVTDSDGGQTFNVSTITSNIAVTAPVTNVIVSQSSGVSNSDVRLAISASDAGGLGSFTYDNVNGIFTYTGPSNSDIRTLFSNTSPITYNSSTGVIGIDTDAVFSNTIANAWLATKTTDDLTEGSTNLYFTAARARSNVSAVDAGGLGSFTYDNSTGAFTYTGPSNSDVRTLLSATDTSNISGYYGSLSYNNTTGVFSLTGVTNTQIRTQFSATSPITYTTATGTIGLSSTANITTSGNITAGYLFGNGSLLTGTYGNTQVANFLANGFGSNNITTTGTVTAGTAIASNVNSSQLTTSSGYYWFSTNNAPIRLNSIVTVSNPDGATLTAHQNAPDANESKITIKSNNVTIDVGGFSSTGRFIVKDSSLAPNTGAAMLQVGANPNNLYQDDVRTWGDIRVGTGTWGDASGNILLKRTGDIELLNSGSISGVNNIGANTILSATIDPPGGTLSVLGNIEVNGNVNYRNVTDLYVTDQKITLNANAVTNANVQIIANRPESTSTDLKWNEQNDIWEFTNDGSTYYPIPASTSNLAEGTNLYYTTDRANTAIAAYQGTISTAGNITTTANVSGQYILGNGSLLTGISGAVDSVNGQTGVVVLDTGDIPENGNLYFTTDRANTAIDNRVTKTFVDGLGVDYNSLANTPVNVSEFINDAGYLVAANLASLTANVDSVNGQTGVVVLDTDNIAEGTTNLYFSNARVNSFIQDNITTTDIDEGTNLYFTTGRVDDHLNTSTANTNQVLSWTGSDYDWVDQTGGGGGTYGDSNVVTLLANLGSNVISSNANIITTGNIDVANLVNVTSLTSVNAFTSIIMDSINPNELIIGNTFGNKLFFPAGGSPTASVGQYLVVDSTSAAGASFAVKNFSLSYENIGTFGNVSAGDPANITYSQTSSIVKATLTGDVSDITVSGVATGNYGFILLEQDATGGHTLSLPSTWDVNDYDNTGTVNIALGASEQTLLQWFYNGSNYKATVTPNIGSNNSTTIRTTGNVEGNYFIGNGSLLTGITASGGNYGDSNVTTLLANLGSNVISSDANITTTGNLTTTAKTVSLITNTERYNIVGANTSAKNTYYVAGSNDTYELPGWHVRWEGTEDANVLFPDNGDTNIDCIQMSVAQFTANTYQGSGDPDLLSSVGPRLLFTSYNGKKTDATNTWYPRVGQEIGRIGFFGPRQNNANPDTLYLDNNFISVVASEDWTTRSPADMYLIARSKGSNSLAPFAWASHQGGNVMLSSSGTNGTSAPPGNIRLSYQASIFNGVAYGSQDNAFMDFAVAGFDDVSTFPGKGVKLVATNGPGGASAINGNYRLGIERNNNSAGMDSTQSWHFTLPSGSNDLILQSNTSSNVATFYTNGNVGIAGTVTATAFIGDGSDVTDVRAKTVEEKVINKSGGTLAKGTPVYATGGVTSDALWVAPCDASNAATMPCIGVLATSLDNDVEGRAIITGTISGVDTSAFTAGDQIYVAVGGGYANVAPAGEANIVQFLGTVTRVDATTGGGVVKIAPPRNERNLNSGNVFIGDGSNFTVTKPLVTAITDANVKLKQFAETVVDLGNVSGDISANIDVANGTIYKMSTTGSITINSLASATAGTSATLIITNGGSHTLSSTMKFAGGSKTLSTGAGDIDIVSVFYDGSTYYATLSKGYA